MNGPMEKLTQRQAAPAMSLPSPPRTLPLLARVKLYWNAGVTGGLFALTMGIVFTVVANHMADYKSVIYFSDGDPTTTGILLEQKKSGDRHSERRSGDSYDMHIYEYTYEVGNTSYEGRSYARENGWKSGDKVTVAYVPKKPWMSRIEGMTAGPFVGSGIALGSVSAFIALIGITLIYFGRRWASKLIYLVRYGELASGAVTGIIPTEAVTNGKPDYEIIFQFEHHDGSSCTGAVTTNEISRLEVGQQVKILYDALDPAKAALVDVLPVDVREFVRP